MHKRVKYPLTLKAQEAARQLAQAWTEEEIPQLFRVALERHPPVISSPTFHQLPDKESLFELEYYKLIQVRIRSGDYMLTSRPFEQEPFLEREQIT